MTKKFLVRAAILVVAVLTSACGGSEPAAPAAATTATSAPTTATPEVSVNAVMVALVDHAAHNLWAVEREGNAPKSDADWSNIVEHAVQLAAAGPAITVGGTGPNDAVWVKTPSWHTYAQRMSDAAVAARKAADSKNMDALVAANGQLVETCEACHKEFKPSLPTEGILHGHAH
jgi:cytochrome c556